MSETYVLCSSCGVHRLSRARVCPHCTTPTVSRTSRSMMLAAALGASLTVTVSTTGCERVNPAMSHYGGPPIEEIEQKPLDVQPDQNPASGDMGTSGDVADVPPTGEAYGAPPIEELEDELKQQDTPEPSNLPERSNP